MTEHRVWIGNWVHWTFRYIILLTTPYKSRSLSLPLSLMGSNTRTSALQVVDGNEEEAQCLGNITVTFPGDNFTLILFQLVS
jgi:hypothetical protein